ncbi:MAG: MlaE family lipid ABC transporter permease subunit [Candidatus Cloacimonadota bacterium]|jgi:phospholipid/cholesterol/gamma-HCH transport system permease protein|nr:MlaE family lipid ABC transporter permease subunit [Candidatus Cloacimonas acidaminovorans]MDI9572604.1 MlaE family lipid ABC transporter permease subunit [Candidatus Cloacimonadota bacterium]HNV62051.1 MlaE family lipid ABC transporter permease subunit [Candidatus Cloacimonas acidaminovorans]HNZ88347.1 MlaE family lipid ABC transporter permease subunit [Candidatus Cloacimonas acidaminovorans]HOI01568.1 MlaE family lipid ABC transporter permease subunit [Candidatus Cloacimonas acidaminovoran
MSCKIVNNILYLEGSLNAQTVPETFIEVNSLLKHQSPNTIDLSNVNVLDSAGVAFLDELNTRLSAEGILLFQGATPEIQEVIDSFSSLKIKVPAPERKMGFFEKIGDSLVLAGQNFYNVMLLASEVFYWAVIGIFSRKGQRKGSFTIQCSLLGSQALPILSLLSFIVGFILSLQASVQLANFGANVFIADLMAFAMVREIAPLITAIIVAGRSGSAIASEIATMQVTEEIDALKTMALSPVRYVVVPKFHAITVVMPILVMFSILVSEIGGGLIAIDYLDLSVYTFVQRSINVLTLKDLVTSFGKSVIFAWTIVIIGAYCGFQVKGGAEGVGKATTSSVVASIFAVIIWDAIFSLLYL